MSMNNDFLVAGVSAVIIIAIIVQLCRTIFKWKDEQLAVTALVAGICLSMLNYAAQVYPSFAPWWEQLILGFMAGATTSGVWTVGKSLINRNIKSGC